MEPPDLIPPISLHEEKRLSNARSNCIAVFGVFMAIPAVATITLFSDMSNLARLRAVGGVGVYLGGVIILYSMIYIPSSWRVLRRLSPITQAVGLIGLTGFVATIILYFVLLALADHGYLGLR